MRLPFVFRSEADRLRQQLARRRDDLNLELRRNGDLRRRVASLELENAEFRRQLRELDAGKPSW